MLSGVNDVVAIAAGYRHSLGLKSDGTVIGWGANAYSQSIPPADLGLTNIVAMAAGNNFSMALRSNGTVLAWGYASYGATDVPQGLSNVGIVDHLRLNSKTVRNRLYLQ